MAHKKKAHSKIDYHEELEKKHASHKQHAMPMKGKMAAGCKKGK